MIFGGAIHLGLNNDNMVTLGFIIGGSGAGTLQLVANGTSTVNRTFVGRSTVWR